MDDLINALQKINTDGLLYWCSERSIEMLKQNEAMMGIDCPVFIFRHTTYKQIMVSAWDLLNIEYLSVVHSNDYKNCKNPPLPATIVNLHRGVVNHDVPEGMKPDSGADIYKALVGMTAEQFQFQNLYWIYEKFNRDYHIFIAANNYPNREKINVNDIVQSTFGFSADDYVAILLLIWWLCCQHPDPLTAPEKLYRTKEETIFTNENLQKFINYYSCSYEELRNSPIGKQLLYSKPFICTQKGTYISSSAYLVTMTLANGLYWLARDSYFKKKSNHFINSFGLLFEDYVKEVAGAYVPCEIWHPIPTGKEKEADFLFDFGDLKVIVEVKTVLLKLDAKQQMPKLASTNTFLDHALQEAYNQLQSSYHRLSKDADGPYMKIILLYDQFSNTSIIEQSVPSIFEADPSCYLLTIRDFEIFLHTYKNDRVKFEKILTSVSKQISGEVKKTAFSVIYEDLGITENEHLNGEMDYYAKIMNHIKRNL